MLRFVVWVFLLLICLVASDSVCYFDCCCLFIVVCWFWLLYRLLGLVLDDGLDLCCGFGWIVSGLLCLFVTGVEVVFCFIRMRWLFVKLVLFCACDCFGSCWLITCAVVFVIMFTCLLVSIIVYYVAWLLLLDVLYCSYALVVLCCCNSVVCVVCI